MQIIKPVMMIQDIMPVMPVIDRTLPITAEAVISPSEVLCKVKIMQRASLPWYSLKCSLQFALPGKAFKFTAAMGFPPLKVRGQTENANIQICK